MGPNRLIRLSKIALVAAMGGFALLVAWGNTVDPMTNFAFVQHVLSMDTVFPDNALIGRAITAPALHWAGFGAIVVTEWAVAGLCLFGAYRLARALSGPAEGFDDAKGPAVAGLTLAVLLWFGGFMVIGGEWFLMWQSEIWNGIDSAFRFAAMMLLVLIFLVRPDTD